MIKVQLIRSEIFLAPAVEAPVVNSFKTTDSWPCMHKPNPPLDIYPANKVISFRLGSNLQPGRIHSDQDVRNARAVMGINVVF